MDNVDDILNFRLGSRQTAGVVHNLSHLAPLAGAFFMRECRGRGEAHNLARAGATPAPATILPCRGRSLTPAVRYSSRLHGVVFTATTIHPPPTSTPALKETHRPSQQFVAGRYMRGGLLGPKQVYLTDSPHKGLPEKEGTKRNKQIDRLTQPTWKAGRGMLGSWSNPTPFDC